MKKKKILGDEGQSSLEFILTFTFALGFMIIFVSLAINLAFGFVVHYATYMSARTYLTYDSSSGTQDVNLQGAMNGARDVFEDFPWSNLDIDNPQDLKFNEPGGSSIYEFVGVHFEYEKYLSLYKMLTGTTKVKFVSEAFLGKEPTRADCMEQICANIQDNGACGPSFNATVFDNGC